MQRHEVAPSEGPSPLWPLSPQFPGAHARQCRRRRRLARALLLLLRSLLLCMHSWGHALPLRPQHNHHPITDNPIADPPDRHQTEPLVAAIRSKLPPAALRALRLVCHAARDDFVDGRCTALVVRARRLGGEALAEVPATWDLCAGPAGRLRSLASLEVNDCGTGGEYLVKFFGVEDCDELAAALERLPSPAALTSLKLCRIDLDAHRQLPACGAQRSLAVARRLAAAICRFRALRSLHFNITCKSDSLMSDALRALCLAARDLPALTALSAAFKNDTVGDAMRKTPAILVMLLSPLSRFETLELGGEMACLLATLPHAPAARPLAALRALRVDFDGYWPEPGERFDAVWRAPWLAQLTRLELSAEAGYVAAADGLFAALPAAAAAPPLLRSLRELVIRTTNWHDGEPEAGVAPRDLLRLLAAANPATLEALHLHDCRAGAAAVLAARVSALTSLKRLTLNGRDFCRSVSTSVVTGETYLDQGCNHPAAPWRLIRKAAFPPSLQSLDVVCGGWLLWRPERLEALLSAPWAAQLVELSLSGGDGDVQDRKHDTTLDARAFAALSSLPALRRLRLFDVGIQPAALEAAAARGWCDGLARSLEELHIFDFYLETGALAALGPMPFERLKRLSVDYSNKPLAMLDLEAFGAKGAPWLARLARLQLGARYTTRAEVWAAALDPDGPLRALHRGGGEVVITR